MVGWHHYLNGHGFGWTLGVGDGQGGLAYCGSWGHKESDTTEQLNYNGIESLSVQFSRSVVSDSLQPHGLQHARPPCPSPTPGACSNLGPSGR